MTRLPNRVLLLALFAGAGMAHAADESEWTYFAETGSWYRAVGGSVIGDGHVSWEQAHADAISRGVHLVDIHSASENAFVQQLALSNDPAHGHWIGLYQPPGSPEPNGGWQWTTGASVTYTNWGGGEPNNSGGSENHAMLIGNNPAFAPDRWNDYNGSSTGNVPWRGGYVLEYSEGNGNSLFANSIYPPGTTAVGPGNNANLILGLPDHVASTGAGLTDFTSYDSEAPYGQVTVSFGGYAVNRAGDDFAVHYGNWSNGEDFDVYASADGLGYQYIGSSIGGNPNNASTIASFDLGSAGMSHAHYIQIRNRTPYTDPAHSNSHHEGVDLDAVEIYGSSAVQAPPDTDRPNYSAIPDSNGRTTLVLYTHGWNTTREDFREGHWAALDQNLRSRLSSSGDTVIVGFDWTEENGSGGVPLLPPPLHAANQAESIGWQIGTLIESQAYTDVHLIGHSAGSWLIDAASDKIKELDPSITVQTTFLDAYVPIIASPGSLGDSADYAEHFVDQSFEDWFVPLVGPIVYSTTGHTLPNAFNVDVTDVDGSPSIGLIPNHGWPVEWYANNVPSDGVNSWGFDRSVALGTMPLYGQTYLGETIEKGMRIYLEGAASTPGDYTPIVEIDPDLVVLDLPSIHSETGTITDFSDGFDMLTGSPVWKTVLVEIAEERNFIIFDAEFMSEEGAEGLLNVFWNGELVGQVDERYVLNGEQEYLFFLEGIAEPGLSDISFRLDPFTEIDSEVSISNIQLGFLLLGYDGDYNGDGQVTAADYTVWADTFGSTTDLRADGNGDGEISAADYTIWADNFGAGTSASVPEPGTLAGLAVLLLCTSRRRRG